MSTGRSRAAARALATCATLLAVAACGDNGTSPLPLPHVELSVSSVSPPSLTTDAYGNPAIMCNVAFHVVSNGTDGARWSRAVLRWYIGKDRSAPVDSSMLSGDDLQAFFSAGDLPTGSTADGAFVISAGIPFGGVLDVAYMGTRDSKERHAVAPFTCGPESTPAATPPTVTATIVTPETAILEPGDTIVLRLTAASNVGLWRTLVGISGPCEAHQIVNDALAPSVVHDVKLVLPASCSLNAPITVTGAALDALAIETDVSVPTTRFIVDRTPPTIRAAHDLPGNFGGAGTAEFPAAGAEYFAGQSVRLHYTIADNHALRALVWEIQPFGARDSVLFSDDTMLARVVDIPIRPEWGSFQMRLFVRDASGNVSPVLESAPGAFVVRPSATLTTTTVTLPDQGPADRLIYDDRSDRLFVLQSDQSRILVYSGSTLALLRKIQFGFTPGDFDITDGGDTVLVSPAGYSGELTLVDISGDTPRQESIPLGLATAAQMGAVRLLANGHILVMASQFGVVPPWQLLEVDIATHAVRNRSIDGASVLGPRSADRSVAYLSGTDVYGASCNRRFDAATDSFSACVSTTASGAMSTSANGDLVLVDRSLYDRSFGLRRNMAFPNAAWSWRGSPLLSPDGQTVFRGYDAGIVRSGTSDGAVVDLIPLPYAAQQLAASADGSTLFAAQMKVYYYNPTPKLSRISLK
ncbi:MAG: hypothetical protein HOQ26_04090 [Gemmatimonadaceae bacterium]|nr:hypothetical protein [Gemmatimonadaceae bacterium]NUQ92080.1 hypothetical protein [Gemmatimonadaceae bacterium]